MSCRTYGNGSLCTPSDTTEHDYDAVWVGGVGNLAVTFAGGNSAVLTAVPAGTLLEFRVKRVLSTDTTATVIVGLMRG